MNKRTGLTTTLTGLLAALILLPGPQVAVAQTATPAARPAAPSRSQGAARPLSAAEQQTLTTLFTKVRPATLRIEDCPQEGSCDEPDGIGSAFLISSDGLALTAYHVVFEAQNLTALTLDKKRYPVSVIGFDDQHDVALIKVNVPAGTPYLPLARQAPAPDDLALVVGNGNGQFFRSATGRLLKLSADAGRADFPPGTLELSARLLPGDSGGVVLNAKGEAVGVVSYISLAGGRSGPVTTLSYAVPVTATSELLKDLKAGVKREAPVIGVSILPELANLNAEQFALINREMKLHLGDTPGAFFLEVREGSPAAKAGLMPLRLDEQKNVIPGDVVTAVNGKRILNFSEFQYAVREYQPGQSVTLTILRGGKEIKVKLTLVGRSTVRN